MPAPLQIRDTLLVSRKKQLSSFAAASFLLAIIWLYKISFPDSLPFGAHVEDYNHIPPFRNDTDRSRVIRKNVAAIIEGRPIENLAPLILHFSSVLGPDWPVFVFTKQDAKVPASHSFQRALKERRVNLVALPPTINFSNRDAVSDFLTHPWIWEELAPAKHVLMFQSDAIVCTNSPRSINYFLEYDFVGAPIASDLGRGDEGMNGGLSLRNRNAVLDVVRTHSWREDYMDNPTDPKARYEDQWFWHKMRDMEYKLPTPVEAAKFSVETLWFNDTRPFGYHQAARFQVGEHRTQVERYCPEMRMAMTEIINN